MICLTTLSMLEYIAKVILGRGPGGSTRPPRDDPPRPIFLCFLDPSKHEKLMPPSPNWMNYLFDALFKMAASKTGKITFLPVTQLLG